MTALGDARDVFARVPASSVLVAVSGGKDSLCTLDLCVRHYGAERVTGFLMYLVRDLECEWRYVRQLEKRYGIRVIGVPHYEKARLLKNCILRPYFPGSERIRLLRQVDVEDHVRKLTGAEWIAWGNRATDSIVRGATLKACRGVDPKGRRLYPVWSWRKPDVYGYLRARKLPIPGITGGAQNATGGVSFDPPTLVWLKREFPADFDKILREFPYAGAVVFRHEQMGIDPVAEVKARWSRPVVRKRKLDAQAAAQGQGEEARDEAEPPAAGGAR